MKSNEKIKENPIQNSGRSDYFFYTHYDLEFSRIGGFGAYPNNGIEASKVGECTYIFKVDEDVKIKISIYDDEFFRLQIFLDQFRDIGRPLPLVNPNDYSGISDYSTSKELSRAMNIMVLPLDTYQDFIANVRLVEETFDRTIIYPEMELGNIATWSLGDTKARDNCITVNLLGNDEWQLLYWERGSSKVILTVFAEKHIYEFFMNEYLNVV